MRHQRIAESVSNNILSEMTTFSTLATRSDCLVTNSNLNSFSQTVTQGFNNFIAFVHHALQDGHIFVIQMREPVYQFGQFPKSSKPPAR
jgi:hypothetical protein